MIEITGFRAGNLGEGDDNVTSLDVGTGILLILLGKLECLDAEMSLGLTNPSSSKFNCLLMSLFCLGRLSKELVKLSFCFTLAGLKSLVLVFLNFCGEDEFCCIFVVITFLSVEFDRCWRVNFSMFFLFFAHKIEIFSHL